MGIYYNPNMASVFNTHIDDAITQLKSAGSTMNSLLKKEFPSKTIIGRRFNNNKSDLENINTTIRDTYNKYLPNIKGDVSHQVQRYLAANQEIYGYMDQIGAYVNAPKKDWKDMSDAEKILERGKMEFLAGFAGRAETVWDGILVHVGEGADGLANFFDYIGATGAESYFDSIGAKCAKSIETDYWGTWRQDQIEMRGMGDDFKWFGDKMYTLGETTFDFTADLAMTAAGVPPVGGVVYSYLTETGESAQDMYRSKNINVYDRNDRGNVNGGAITIGLVNGSADYASQKLLGGLPAKSLHGAFLKKGGISALTGTYKTITKKTIEHSVTGDEQFYLDPHSIAQDATLTFIVSGSAGSIDQHKKNIKNAKPTSARGKNTDDTFDRGLEDVYDGNTDTKKLSEKYRDKASKTRDEDLKEAYENAANSYEKYENYEVIPKKGSQKNARKKLANAQRAEKTAESVRNVSIVSDIMKFAEKFVENK